MALVASTSGRALPVRASLRSLLRPTHLPRGRASRLGAFDPNREIVVGDALVLTTFAIGKQIGAIVMSPSFPGE